MEEKFTFSPKLKYFSFALIAIGIIALIIGGLRYTRKKGKIVWNTAILALTLILIGYSSFFMLVIRANANPPINENDPKDAISLLSYLNREQYGSWPLLYGQYYNAPSVDVKDGKPVYAKDAQKGKYVIVDDKKGTMPVYDPRFETIFPRMWSNTKPEHIDLYKQYGKIKGIPLKVTKPDGSTEIRYRPTFGENLRFFFSYQIGHMYVRYFMWNFVGRQNNIESQGEINHGNWISGIGFIDNWRLGNQTDLPASMENPARTRFYFLPLLLGLLGFLFHLSKSKKDTWVVFLLFFMTGIAIIIYLNQTPLQPRERDYAYAGSFYAFAIWIGFGVLAIYDALKDKIKNKTVIALAITLASLVLVPGIMAKEGWKSHDRSGKYAARDFARMYLESCEPNAILFTNGDNDTFPLWYVQEVEGIRTDVRVVNFMLASGDWYVDQMFRKVYESDPLPLSNSRKFYAKGSQNYMPVFERVEGTVELKDLVNFVGSDDTRTQINYEGEWINYVPARKLELTVDKAAVLESGTVAPEDSAQIVDKISWQISQGYLYRNDLMLLDLIATNNWERPIYFANPSSVSKVLNIDKYCHLEGIVYRFKPTVAKDYIKRVGGVNPERTYEILMADDVRWGRLNEPDVTVDRESDRNSNMIKQDYLRLAQAMVNEKKNDSAVAVLDRGIYFFPDNKIHFDYFMIPWADMYYKAGAVEKGNDLVNLLYNRYKEDLDYYTSLDKKFMQFYTDDIQESFAVLQRLSELAKENNQNDLSDEIRTYLYDQVDKLNVP